MKKIFLALVMILVTVSTSSASSADENFHSTKSKTQNGGNIFLPNKSDDKELQSLIAQYASKFTVHKYSDDVSGLSIEYSIYFPENCKNPKEYPVVFFMADASSAGKEPSFSITQGYGALVWCIHDCIVVVPAMPSVVIDDHDGFVESDYVELTARFVKWAKENYGFDDWRIYSTGQSMGCMTWLVLNARYPDLFTASMFVSGQWDIKALKGLIGQKFVYLASAGDPKASAGLKEVAEMFTNESQVEIVEYLNIDAKNSDPLILHTQPVNFVMFRKGTTLPDSAGEYSEHMTSFDYAYKMAMVRQWLLAQTKED